jgi:hypothetical protein
LGQSAALAARAAGEVTVAARMVAASRADAAHERCDVFKI